MSVTSALARDTPVTANTIDTGSWNALKSGITPLACVKSWRAPTFTMKKKTGTISAGMKNSGSRNTPRIARWATVARS